MRRAAHCPESGCNQNYRISVAFPIFFGAGSSVTETSHRKTWNATEKGSPLLNMFPGLVTKISNIILKIRTKNVAHKSKRPICPNMASTPNKSKFGFVHVRDSHALYQLKVCVADLG